MIEVEDSALKHGLVEDEVRHAWNHLLEYVRYKDGKLPPHYLGLGILPDGKTAELAAYSDGLDWHVFHAMTPPTKGFMHEFRKAKREQI